MNWTDLLHGEIVLLLKEETNGLLKIELASVLERLASRVQFKSYLKLC